MDGRGTIGVLDWAEAEPAGLPLTDFFYAIGDAAAACDGYRDRLEAVRACFVPGGQRADLVAPLQERLRTSLGLAGRPPSSAFTPAGCITPATSSAPARTARSWRSRAGWRAGRESLA